MAKNFFRQFSSSKLLYKTKIGWKEDLKTKAFVEKAKEHYDDFYSTIFGNKWPSIRLALLSQQKFVAVGNNHSGEIEKIINSLEKLGTFDLNKIWHDNYKSPSQTTIESEASHRKNEIKTINEMKEKVEAYARAKKAEEMDILYQNMPIKKIPIQFEKVEENKRMLTNIQDAANQYVTATKFRGFDDYTLESEYYDLENKMESQAEEAENIIIPEYFNFTTNTTASKLEFPQFLKAFTFVEGSSEIFPSAKKSHSGTREYICVNGASLIPILALDLKLGVSLLDLCSGPGTKSLIAYFTMCPNLITCNDISSSRINRVKRLFHEFLGDKAPNNLFFTRLDATNYPVNPKYDRVLADVPCSMDRISLTEADNNLFKPSRIKERLGIVKNQKDILLSALKVLSKEKNSCCVYSTCTLSPVENDGVVLMALKESEYSPNLAIDLIGLWNVLKPLRDSRLFHIKKTKFGITVLPNILSNFGPMYISRIVAL